MTYKFDNPFKAYSRTSRQYTPSQLKQRRGEDAYRAAHEKAKSEGKSGEEMHQAGVKAQRELAFVSTDDRVAF